MLEGIQKSDTWRDWGGWRNERRAKRKGLTSGTFWERVERVGEKTQVRRGRSPEGGVRDELSDLKGEIDLSSENFEYLCAKKQSGKLIGDVLKNWRQITISFYGMTASISEPCTIFSIFFHFLQTCRRQKSMYSIRQNVARTLSNGSEAAGTIERLTKQLLSPKWALIKCPGEEK